jgi:Alkylmercury lyase
VPDRETATLPAMDHEDLRLAIYGALRTTGRVPDRDALADELAVTRDEIDVGIEVLAKQRHVVLDGDGSIVMAHPFATIPLGFSVMGRETLWWGGCAWDSFAMVHLLPEEPELLVATKCRNCGTPQAWVLDREAPPAGDWLAHFLVPAARIWDDVVHTCDNQRLFCSRSCIDAWLERTGNELGYVMDLATLWRFASRWYEGRLERGYVRRDPSSALKYFRSVGLSGAFWGLDA